jgi:UDPglucose 6-dehydrogenase
MTHLGQTLRKASEIRGFDIAVDRFEDCDVVFVTQDVEDHYDLVAVRMSMTSAIDLPVHIPIVLVSQVPPGFTRPWLKKRGNIFYQVDTIIMNRALERATLPERFIVGCEGGEDGIVPAAYGRFLMAFNCPVIWMSFESAELSKLAINYLLAKQLEAANALAAVARHIGADWDEMIPGLRLDARIGQHAYIRPGEVGGHLPRDVRTIERLLKEATCGG